MMASFSPSRWMAASLLLCHRPLGAAGARVASSQLPHVLLSQRRPVGSRMPAPVAVASAEAPPPLMDERLIASDPEVVRKSLSMRRASDAQLAAVERIGELTRERAELVASQNEALSVRKKLSPQIGKMMKEGDREGAESLKQQVAAASKSADEAEVKMELVENERKLLFEALPNLLDSRTPDGGDEDGNVEISRWGCEGELRTDLKWHDELATELGALDLGAAAKLSGARFAVLKGSLARMERALISLFLDMHTAEHGYTEAAVPFLVGRDALEGTGQLPKFEEGEGSFYPRRTFWRIFWRTL